MAKKAKRAAARVTKKAAAARRAAAHAKARGAAGAAKPSAKRVRAPKKALANKQSMLAAEARAARTAKQAARKAEKRSVKTAKGATAAVNGNGLPKPSNKPFGQAGKALEGVRILDFTHVQSGPTCTQLLGYMGADVIKVERPGVGDITRGQLRDVPNADSLYFTMLNGNKRSITIDSKHPKGREILDRLIKQCDVLVENFAPGALDRMGLTWEHIHKLNPRMIVASVKGFGPGPYEDCKVYENVAQCAGGSASTTGFREGPPLVTGAQIGDSGTGLHLALGIVSALYQRIRTGRGQKVLCAMQDGVLNLARVKLRDQQRLAHGPLEGIQPVRRERAVRQIGAARRQRLGRRAARLDPEVQGLGGRSRRLHLFHHAGAGVGRDLRPDRQARVEDRSGLRDAECAAAAAQVDLRHDRGMDQDHDQVRGHG